MPQISLALLTSIGGPLCRLKHTAFVVVGLILGFMVLRPARPESASPTLQQLSAQVDALTARVTTLEGQVSALQGKTQFVTVDGNEIYITGANLNIRNGLGYTGCTNGLGNLIVGYNENSEDRSRVGSHNLVVGANHGYSSFGGLVAGFGNTISGGSASVIGGSSNTASGNWAVVSGGANNTASGFAASVSGGTGNTASGFAYASVSGGANNTASGSGTSVSGGLYNIASNNWGSVSGGGYNTASGYAATVSGFVSVTQSDNYGWSGGAYHTP
jgi:hypothetical protein